MNSRRFFMACLFVVACAFARVVSAQSTDQALPTPVLANDLNGKIVALDVGDPRATRHFYAFAASPGDLLITIDSKNLDGDVDVFTAITFRPLMKTTLYSTSQSAPVTKGIYLRAHQLLILRVEARTPSDDPGTYHIHFGGGFEPFSGGIPVAENAEPADTSAEKASKNRLSSVGATLSKPPAELTETGEAKPSPSPEKSAENTSGTDSAKAEKEKPKTNARNTPARPPRRSTRPTTSRRQPPPKKVEPATKSESDTAATESNNESTKTEPAKNEPAKTEKSTEEKSPGSEKSAPNASADKSKSQETPLQLSGARLIIEEKDGTRVERPMATVRRVVIEGATIVITLKTGRIERIAMANVARMAIEPQQ